MRTTHFLTILYWSCAFRCRHFSEELKLSVWLCVWLHLSWRIGKLSLGLRLATRKHWRRRIWTLSIISGTEYQQFTNDTYLQNRFTLSLSLPLSTTNALKRVEYIWEKFVPNCGCQGILLELLHDATLLHFAPKPRRSPSCSHRFEWCRHSRNEEECREPAIEARQTDRQMQKKESSALGKASFLTLQTPFKYSLAVPNSQRSEKVYDWGVDGQPACVPAYLNLVGTISSTFRHCDWMTVWPRWISAWGPFEDLVKTEWEE